MLVCVGGRVGTGLGRNAMEVLRIRNRRLNIRLSVLCASNFRAGALQDSGSDMFFPTRPNAALSRSKYSMYDVKKMLHRHMHSRDVGFYVKIIQNTDVRRPLRGAFL